jgi:hypothetical protein
MSDEDPLSLDMTLSLHDKVLNFAKKFPDNLIKYEYKYNSLNIWLKPIRYTQICYKFQCYLHSKRISYIMMKPRYNEYKRVYLFTIL